MNISRCLAYILFLTLFLSAMVPVYADQALPTPIARVVWVKGTFKATMQNKEVRTLQKTSIIYLHDVLTTDANSQAEIVFTDNSLMTFREKTTFTVDQYSSSSKKGGANKFISNLLEGGFRTVTGLIAKRSPTDYQVNTPVATIGVRGTEYSVYVHDGKLFVGYYSGSPCVTNNKHNATLCLDSKTKYAVVPSANQAPVPLTAQPQELNQDLQIISASLGPFNNGGGTGGGTSGGAITSFCIQ